MSTSRVRLTANKQGEFEAAEQGDTAMQTSYQSPGLQTTPEVIYTRNLVSMPYGVKSTNLQKEFVDELNWMPEVLNGYDDGVSSGKPLHLGRFLDSMGVSRYVFFEEASSPMDTQYGYFHHTPVDLTGNPAGLFKFYERPFQEEDADSELKYCIYQNRTLFLKDSVTELTWPPSAVIAGDTVLEGEEAFFEISGPEPVVTFYKPTGIQFRDAAEDSFKVGIVAFGNYLITWDKNTIYYCNPLSFVDWTPSAAGAGLTRVSAARGNIVSVQPAPNGIHVFCKDNTVFGAFTGDAGTPFAFSEVIGGGGLNVLGGRKLLTYDSDTGYSIAFTTAGLQVIRENRSELLPDKVNRYFSGTYVDKKLDGTSRITKADIGTSAGIQRTMVRGLFLSQKLLFIYCALPVPLENSIENGRLIVYNLETQGISMLEGDYPCVTRRVDLGRFTNVSPAQISSKPGLISNQFAIIRRIVSSMEGGIGDRSYRLAMRVLDFANSQLPSLSRRAEDQPFQLATGLVLIGDISISAERTTVITAIRLRGTTTRADGQGRAKVRVYSPEIYGPDTPVEFIYSEKYDTYYGLVEGRSLKVEVEGNYLYLKHVEIEIARGGYI